MTANDLIRKYNVAAPRYTSYPTVPYWDAESWSIPQWLDSAAGSGTSQEISIYIHLPFCESLCTYCGCHTRITKNHGVEIPYIDAVLQEWQMYTRLFGAPPVIREIHLGGGTPTFFSAANLEKLIRGIKSLAHIADDAELSFEAHPANTTSEHLQTLYNLGFRRLSLGIQDFDPQVQAIINRKQTVGDVERVCKEARKIGYTSINFDLIYGLPLQKMAGIVQTITEVIRMRPERIAYYSYAHVPWIKPGQRKFTELDLPKDEEKRALYEKGRDMLIAAGYNDIGMDHFALPDDALHQAAINGSLHRNFMGYTGQQTRFILGLGVSAISDSWQAFAQNEKSVEKYLEEIANHRFPLIKGHILSAEDLLIREVILDIMCKGATAVGYAMPQWDDIRTSLEPLVRDGLVLIDRDTLRVTEQGKPFLRNICMCFDLRLAQHQPKANIFSAAV